MTEQKELQVRDEKQIAQEIISAAKAYIGDKRKAVLESPDFGELTIFKKNKGVLIKRTFSGSDQGMFTKNLQENWEINPEEQRKYIDWLNVHAIGIGFPQTQERTLDPTEVDRLLANLKNTIDPNSAP